MDLSRIGNDRKLYLCKWYFNFGLLFLPFLWAINCVWFFGEAFRKPPYEEQPQIKKCVYALHVLICIELNQLYLPSDVLLSAVGAAVWSVVIFWWVFMFQTNRANWSFADDISFVIPLGQR